MTHHEARCLPHGTVIWQWCFVLLPSVLEVSCSWRRPGLMVVVFICDDSFCLCTWRVERNVLPQGFVGGFQCTLSGPGLCFAPHFRKHPQH